MLYEPPTRRPARAVPWASKRWCDYFRANARSLLEIPWELGAPLPEETLAAVRRSIQEFQLGESSEGRHLLRCAEAYAAREGEPAYVDAVRLFIGEEQRHARDLGRFLASTGVPLLARSWPDTVFRWLRRKAGLEVSVGVLITAEIIAKVYYAALREATGSPVLRGLCEQILRDEVEHVRFQAERLAMLRAERTRWSLAFANRLHRFLFWGTCLVVWWKHGRAMHAGGFGFRRFWRASWREMHDALRRMDPLEYRVIGADRNGACLPAGPRAGPRPARH